MAYLTVKRFVSYENEWNFHSLRVGLFELKTTRVYGLKDGKLEICQRFPQFRISLDSFKAEHLKEKYNFLNT